MKNKRFILIAILALAIGFATVTTTLYINGQTKIVGDSEGFAGNVIFTDATTDSDGSATIEQDGKEITYSSKQLKALNDEAVLNFEISNLDKNYDVNAIIACKFINSDLTESDTNDYVTLTLSKSSHEIPSGAKANGTLTAKLVAVSETEQSLSIKCTINASAVERDSIGEVTKATNNVLTGTITDSSNNALTTGYLAVYSDEMKVVTIGTDGSINVTDLEDGIHEIYYMGETDPTGKTKSEVKTSALASGTFTTSMTNETIVLSKDDTKYYINNVYVGPSQGINLYKMMKTNAKSDTVDFSVRSGDSTTPTNGIYTTKATESGKEVYYYRGKVNNNLIFNNMCWKIVRTTETGGVKLIYNGLPSSGTCNNTGDASQLSSTSAFNTNYNDNAYVGYMYGTAGSSTYDATHKNTNNSTIKTAIDTWYGTNFTSESVKNKIEDTVYCNDRSTKAYDATTIGDSSLSSYGALGYGTNATLYGAAHRASSYTITPSPSLVCTNNNDKFTVNTSNGNGALTYPVGLITLDEAVFAGFNTYSSNTSDNIDTNNYLYTGSIYWTLSPVRMALSGSAYVGLVYSSIYDDDYLCVDSALGVRPAISLASGTVAKAGGEGTTSNPYVVE